MDDTLEHPDDGLRDRIRKGFEANTKNRSKIEDRPKTPRSSNKGKHDVTINKKITEIPDEIQKPTTQKKTKMEKKSVVQKPNIKPEVTDEIKKMASKTPSKKVVKPDVGVYICPKCDKTYKSKNGIVTHMKKCM